MTTVWPETLQRFRRESDVFAWDSEDRKDGAEPPASVGACTNSTD
jgi:hypothetical protein